MEILAPAAESPESHTLAFRFALAPTPAQEQQFRSHAGASRFAYNWGLATTASALDEYAVQKAAGVEKPDVAIPTHFDLCKAWTAHKDDPDNELGWVGENFVGTYQAALRDASVAWKRFFSSRGGKLVGRRVGRPRFKKKGRAPDSFQVHGSTLRIIDGSHVKLPKIGTVKIPGLVRCGGYRDRNARTNRKLARLIRQGKARITRGTVSRAADGTWWISLTADLIVPLRTGPSRRQRAGGVLGVDLGVRNLAVTSTGTVYENPRHLGTALGDLAAAQRQLSRRIPGSSRHAKAQRLVGMLHAQVALRRKDTTDRMTTAMVRNHSAIVVEGFDVQRLAQKGSKDVPRHVRRRRNRELADAAPGMIRWQLEQKAARLGVTIFKTAPEEPTGRTCSACGVAKTKPVPPADVLFRCESCGTVTDRRVNTARLLATIGRKSLAEGT